MQELQDIYRLQALVTVVDEGSLTAAVSRLHITQPALSARLKLLEDSLGCALLERTGRGVRPTPVGRIVYTFAKDILRRMDELALAVRNQLELREGWVHLGGGNTAVLGILPDAIQRFRASHPGIQFTLVEQDSLAVEEAVRVGRLDLGLVTRAHAEARTTRASAERGSAVEADGLRTHGVIPDRLVVIAPPGHPLARAKRPLAAERLADEPMILFPEPSVLRSIIDGELTRLGLRPRVVMTLRSIPSMIRMVERGLGLSIVSEACLAVPPGASGSVSVLEITGLDLRRGLAVVSSAERTLPHAAQAFVDVLLASDS